MKFRQSNEIGVGGSPKGIRTPSHDTFNLINSTLPIGKQMGATEKEMSEHYRETIGAESKGLEPYWDGLKIVQRLMDKLPKRHVPADIKNPHLIQKKILLGTAGTNAVRSEIGDKATKKSIFAISKSRTANATTVTENKTPAFMRILQNKTVPMSGTDIPRQPGFGIAGLKLQAPTNVPLSSNWLNRTTTRMAVRNGFVYPQSSAQTRKKQQPANRDGFFQYGINNQAQRTFGYNNKVLANYHFYVGKKTTGYRSADETIKPVAHNIRASNSGLARWSTAERLISSLSMASTKGKEKVQKIKGRKLT